MPRVEVVVVVVQDDFNDFVLFEDYGISIYAVYEWIRGVFRANGEGGVEGRDLGG